MAAPSENSSEPPLKFAHAPIVEAVLDVRCDMPPAFDLAGLESAARDVFRAKYPKFQKQLIQEHRVEQKGDEPPKFSEKRGIQALQFLTEDQRQLVQVRAQGFSFNRLAPYSSLDDYLPEIEQTWRSFVELTAPVQIRQIRLRYINRLPLPTVDGRVEFTEYLRISPRLPDEDKLHFVGFLNQHAAVDIETGNQVNIVMTMQPGGKGVVPLIFDIEAICISDADPSDWQGIRSKIASLRSLKNHVFQNTLTEKCLNLFQH